jgi:hypothetical protein
MKTRPYLILRAADRSARITTRYPRLRSDEIAYRVEIEWPDAWGYTVPEPLIVTLPTELPTVATNGGPIEDGALAPERSDVES